MQALLQVFQNEWLGLYRNKLLIGSFLLLVFILSLTAWMGVKKQDQLQVQTKTANDFARNEWESIGPMNPHSAAHEGTYAYYSPGLMSSLDEGVLSQVGRVLRLEGHVQNEMAYSARSQESIYSRFGGLMPSLLLQWVVPLLLIFLSFRSIYQEKEQGRITLLLSQGLGIKQILVGKALAYFSIACIALLSTVLVQFIFLEFNHSNDVFRLIGFVISYLLFYWLIVSLTIVLSTVLKNATGALSSMLAIWVLWMVLLPKWTASIASERYPLPSRFEFKQAMKDDRSKGIDGHNPSKDRVNKLRDSVLAKYGVSSDSALPINLDGIVMQADEEYGNLVWDKHIGGVFQSFSSQKKLSQWASVFNPMYALKSASMSFAGTDMLHHIHFQREAEEYRRGFIKKLNDEHAYGGSKTGDWSWKSSEEFFKNIETFQYTTVEISKYKSYWQVDLLILLVWSISISVLMCLISKKYLL